MLKQWFEHKKYEVQSRIFDKGKDITKLILFVCLYLNKKSKTKKQKPKSKQQKTKQNQQKQKINMLAISKPIIN